MDRKRIDNLNNAKEKITNFLEINGPSVPIKIAGMLGIDSLLASAILSEMLSDKKIKISSMRVGNSPLYFLPGDEKKLEGFVNYLGQKEKEAYELIKNKKILKDNRLEPAIRVALRNLKDFTSPINIRGEIFWRYFQVDENEAVTKVEDKILSKMGIETEIKSEREPVIKRLKKVIMPSLQKNPEKPEILKLEKDIEPKINIKSDIPEIKKIKRSKEKQKSDFIFKIEEFFERNNIKVVKEIEMKKKEYSAVVRIDEKVDYLCIAKEKKIVNDKDLMAQLELGKKEKMPVLFISNGEVNKKAVEWLDYLENIIIYKKIR
ncbi:MAG: hypothetical protein QW727_00445 [Candidatus Pacearchaeota archaeon]